MNVSIIMPVLNGEPFISEALDSTLRQTQPPAEILVVDNGSTDRTAEIVQSYPAPVRLLHEPFPSAARARLTGVAEASGEALMFLDADDLISPTVLEELGAVLKDQPGAIACCPWVRYEQVDGEWQTKPASCTPRKGGQSALAAWLSGWYHPPCAVLWSAEAYRRSGGWDPASFTNDDGDLVMRALVEKVPLIRTAGGLAYYRRLPEGQVSLSAQRFSARALTNRLKVIERIEQRLVERGDIFAYRVALRRAFAAIAHDAKDCEELNSRAEAGAERNKPAYTHMLRDFLMRAGNKIGLLEDRPERRRLHAVPGKGVQPR